MTAAIFDDKLSLVHRADGMLKEIDWWYIGDEGAEVGLWLGFKTIQSDQNREPEGIIFLDLPEDYLPGKHPQILSESELSIFLPREEMKIQLPYEIYGTTGTGWSEERNPGHVHHREEGNSTFGTLGLKLFKRLGEIASRVDGDGVIVVLEEIELEEAKANYHRPFDRPPSAKLGFTVFSKN